MMFLGTRNGILLYKRVVLVNNGYVYILPVHFVWV